MRYLLTGSMKTRKNNMQPNETEKEWIELIHQQGFIKPEQLKQIREEVLEACIQMLKEDFNVKRSPCLKEDVYQALNDKLEAMK